MKSKNKNQKKQKKLKLVGVFYSLAISSSLFYLFLYWNYNIQMLIVLLSTSIVVFTFLFIIGNLCSVEVLSLRIGVYWSFLICSLHAFYTGGIESSTTQHLMLFSLFGFYFYPKKDIYLFIVISFLLLCAVGILTVFGYTKNYITEDLHLSFLLINHVSAIMIIFLFALVFRLEGLKFNRIVLKANVDLKDTTRKLVESEKLASVGQLAAGLAHEINNPLNYIAGSANIIQKIVKDIFDLEDTRDHNDDELKSILEQYPKSIRKVIEEQIKKTEETKNSIEYKLIREELTVLLDSLQNGVKRMSDIVKGLRIYGGSGEFLKSYFDIIECLDLTIIMLNHLLIGNISLVKSYQTVPHVYGNKSKVSQVIINVMTNAIQAISEGKSGKVGEINVSCTELTNYIRIAIKDNGLGIPVNIKYKVFNPFFTTKEVGVGTGLGLSISKGIMDEHNGRILFESTSSGTTFFIDLPKEEKPDSVLKFPNS